MVQSLKPLIKVTKGFRRVRSAMSPGFKFPQGLPCLPRFSPRPRSGGNRRIVLNVGKYVVISTGHVLWTDDLLLRHKDCSVTAYSFEYGYVLVIPPYKKGEQGFGDQYLDPRALREFGFSDQFIQIVTEAQRRGWGRVFLDRDGGQLDGLVWHGDEWPDDEREAERVLMAKDSELPLLLGVKDRCAKELLERRLKSVNDRGNVNGSGVWGRLRAVLGEKFRGVGGFNL